MNLEGKWAIHKSTVDTVNIRGGAITLPDITTYVSDDGIEMFDADDLIRAEQIEKANKAALKPRQVHELLLLYAPVPFDNKRNVIEQKYRFNKMLFYLKEKVNEIGYGNAYVFDEFVSARAGPVPKNLSDDLVFLAGKGLISISGIKNGKVMSEGADILKRKEVGTSVVCKLTSKGETLAKELWEETPGYIQNLMEDLKVDLMLITAEALKEKVHKEYPQYKKTYVELDAT